MLRLLIIVVLCTLVCRAAHAAPVDILPVITSLLLEETNADPEPPIHLHPDAGQHLPFPLRTQSGALPFGYYRYLPIDFTLDPRKKFPLLVFLHGLGEVGNGVTNLNKVLANGPPKMIQNGIEFPAIVVSPQVTIGTWQKQRDGVDIPADLNTLVGYFKNNFNVDPDRIYVTGLSLGGGGAWNYTRLYNDEVAAVVPVCGVGTNGVNINQLSNLGVWAFHSIDDNVVASRNTARQMNLIGGTSLDGPNGVMADYPDDGDEHVVSRVNNAWQWQRGRYNGQGNTRYTVFPDASHNSWVRAYNQDSGLNSPMWDWLFAQRRQ